MGLSIICFARSPPEPAGSVTGTGAVSGRAWIGTSKAMSKDALFTGRPQRDVRSFRFSAGADDHFLGTTGNSAKNAVSTCAAFFGESRVLTGLGSASCVLRIDETIELGEAEPLELLLDAGVLDDVLIEFGGVGDVLVG